MVGFLLRAAIAALGLWVASQIFDGLHFVSPSKLLVAAILLGIVPHDANLLIVCPRQTAAR